MNASMHNSLNNFIISNRSECSHIVNSRSTEVIRGHTVRYTGTMVSECQIYQYEESKNAFVECKRCNDREPISYVSK